MSRLDPSARVRNHIIEVLSDHPMTFEDLTAALVARGLELGPDPDERIDAVMDSIIGIDWMSVPSPDDPDQRIDLVFDRPTLYTGTTWTIPITELDLRSDTLSFEVFGLAFMILLNKWAVLEGDATVGVDREYRRRNAAADMGLDHSDPKYRAGLALTEGWLADLGAQPGHFLQLQMVGDVMRATVTDTAPEPTDEMVKALAEVVDHNTADSSVAQATVLTELLLTHDWLRSTPLPALDDWFDAAGLSRNGTLLAPAGYDFDAERLQDQIDDAVYSHGLEGRDVTAFTTVFKAWHDWQNATDKPDPTQLSAVVNALNSLPVTYAIADSIYHENVLDDLTLFGEALIEAATGRHGANPAWILAQAAGREGLTVDFEDWIDTALVFDDHHVLAVLDKAWFEFDRGEYRKSKALMVRIGMPDDDHDMQLIDEVLNAASPNIGRNDPCPCGSGRKYKRCHLGVDEIPLSDRLTLLYRKANRWLQFRHNDLVHMYAITRAGDTGMPAAQLLESDPLIPDAALTEDHYIDDWLSERGALLPSDEAMLAEQWALTERSVFEVTEARHDQGMTLRDVRTGDVVDVVERLGTHGMATGNYLLVRPLPVGDGTYQFFGGITFVPDQWLHSFIELLDSEPNALGLLKLVAQTQAPPQLHNTDGDEMVVCETTWTISDPTAALSILDETFHAVDPADKLSTDPDTPEWTWLSGPDEKAYFAGDSEEDAGRTVFGNVYLIGNRLTVDTNSIERMDRAAEIILDLFPDAITIEELQSTSEDLREDAAYERYIFDDSNGDSDDTSSNSRSGSNTGLFDPAQASPEVQEALRKQMDLYEQRWVDESIPALGGATPREALDDPTRREDLFRLLDQMEEMESRLPINQAGLGMRTSRLRELLGL